MNYLLKQKLTQVFMLLQKEGFILEMVSKELRQFLEWFTETQMFEVFIVDLVEKPDLWTNNGECSHKLISAISEPYKPRLRWLVAMQFCRYIVLEFVCFYWYAKLLTPILMLERSASTLVFMNHSQDYYLLLSFIYSIYSLLVLLPLSKSFLGSFIYGKI